MMPSPTTDNQDELFTQVDEHDTIIGPVTREFAHQHKKCIHRSIGIFLSNSQNEILFQQRSVTKDKNPGLWSYSVGGHVKFGDDYLLTAERELLEELGISTSLKFLTKSLIFMPTETELTAFFEAKIIGNSKLKLQNDEVASVKWVPLHQIPEFIKSHQMATWAIDGLKRVGYLK